MKKSLFALFASSLLLGACQSAPRVMPSAVNPALRASSVQRNSVARNTNKPYSIEDYRSYLTGKLFEALDQNRDQVVTAQEFSRLLDKNAVAGFASFDASRDGSLNQVEFLAAKNQILQPRYAEATLREKLTAFFQTQDIDRNGVVSYSEGKGMLNLLFDYDHDNNFSVEEFVDATSSLLHLDPAKTEACLKAHLG